MSVYEFHGFLGQVPWLRARRRADLFEAAQVPAMKPRDRKKLAATLNRDLSPMTKEQRIEAGWSSARRRLGG